MNENSSAPARTPYQVNAQDYDDVVTGLMTHIQVIDNRLRAASRALTEAYANTLRVDKERAKAVEERDEAVAMNNCGQPLAAVVAQRDAALAKLKLAMAHINMLKIRHQPKRKPVNMKRPKAPKFNREQVFADVAESNRRMSAKR